MVQGLAFSRKGSIRMCNMHWVLLYCRCCSHICSGNVMMISKQWLLSRVLSFGENFPPSNLSSMGIGLSVVREDAKKAREGMVDGGWFHFYTWRSPRRFIS
jgi:hypothetical protein